MQVKDFLAGSGAVIKHQPKSISNPFPVGNLLRHEHELSQKSLVGCCRII